MIMREIDVKINKNFIGLIMAWEISLFSYSIRDIEIILRIWDFIISLQFYNQFKKIASPTDYVITSILIFFLEAKSIS